MPDGSGGAVRGLHEAPLSSAFRQAWLKWSQEWQDLPKESDPAVVVSRVVEFSGRCAQRLWRMAFATVGDAASEQVKSVVYAFVALVDETLLFTPWPGQLAWQQHPLESRMYSSRQAGERLPAAIKKLLDEQMPGTRDLANVYLQCLILGFQGRLRGEPGQVQHEKWRVALFTFAWQHEPDFVDVSERLALSAAAPPLRMPAQQSLPDGLRLGLAILAMVMLLTGLGQVFWRDIRGALEPVLQLNESVVQEQDS
ncbi:DotU family type IV/VI secretion system protein [Pseudomonas sp. P97.38]|uniref:DotU family type IV/VI secretion system protein n=1 Tax=Pseudomonas sp. P97.38 TaxID=255451 RepID=UPI00069F9D63|nr:DotU/TssL family secretion system protein [Pseudomonas sp. P97.38]